LARFLLAESGLRTRLEGRAMPDSKKEHEYAEEAERLRQLPRAEQRQIVALHRSVADNPKVPKRDRAAARELADALDRLLKLGRKRGRNL
jgi:hypothetical protein